MGNYSDSSRVRHNKSSSFYCCSTINQFFRRPKLRIEHDSVNESDTFAPARTYHNLYGSYTQKYLRLRVRNKGHSVAQNCSAQIRVVIPTGSNPNRYPSRDTKQLTWGRSADKSDLSEQINIHPFIGEGICHVIFSDSRFRGIQTRYARHAFISILDRLKKNEFREEDGFSVGRFIVEVIISSNEAYCKGKFIVDISDDFETIFMRKLTRYQSIMFRIFKIFPS
jgi:hypothetical protein